MMFGGKRELEKEIEALREQKQKSEEVAREVLRTKEDAEKQFGELEASYQQSAKHMEQIAGALSHVERIASESSGNTEDVHNAMVEMNYGLESFGANHTAFLERLKNQNERFSEFLEQHRKYLEPLEKLCEVQEQMLEGEEKTDQTLMEMREYSKNMNVLALNAAIEAGRMGEEAEGLVRAAEEVRACSQNYERSAELLSEELNASKARVSELEEELQKLSRLFKECTIAMGKLYNSSVQEVADYEREQIKLQELASFDMAGKAEAARQSGEELLGVRKEISSQIEAADGQIERQRQHTRELEEIYRKLQRQAEALQETEE